MLLSYPAAMSTRLRDFRDMAGMTLEEVAARVGMTAGNLSRLERGLIPYSQSSLEALAAVYSCRVADLVEEDPGATRQENHLRQMFRGLTHEDRLRALRLIAALKGGQPGEQPYPMPTNEGHQPTLHEIPKISSIK